MRDIIFSNNRYGVPSSHCNKLEELLQSEVPDLCTYQQHCLFRNNLHCMVPPSVLSSKSVPVYRLVQEPGEFIIVADKAARANICTGYSMSEAIPCASVNSLKHCIRAFEICQELKQSTLFSVEHLLCVLTTNAANLKTNANLLRDLRTKLIHIRDRELSLRHQLTSAGLKSSKCFADSETCGDTQSLQTGSKSRNQHALDKGCHVCRQLCYLSMVSSKT
ncbi:protein Jumonji-like [Lytechinus variegatus]|uniref:protein Jumonji-like n=1 Tax=Lytechinus variegatus TaxID=7654 RepID=UPI001BB23344|nr:protein Jumonji-like [Lytechinus variegatus]